MSNTQKWWKEKFEILWATFWDGVRDDVSKGDVEDFISHVESETVKRIIESMPKRPKDMEMLPLSVIDTLKNEGRTGVEFHVENKRRDNTYQNYLSDLEKWASSLSSPSDITKENI